MTCKLPTADRILPGKGDHAMPIYEFFCRKCQEPFTALMTIQEHDKQAPECPRCHDTKEVEKRISPAHAVTTRKSLTY
ncbi:FmdB family zinc ribbon protein [Corallococcus interemptor]|nr:zinc ribbon domain-containing protein [Corallococcus interemptor]